MERIKDLSLYNYIGFRINYYNSLFKKRFKSGDRLINYDEGCLE